MVSSKRPQLRTIVSVRQFKMLNANKDLKAKVEAEFKDILHHALTLGITTDQLESLESVRTLLSMKDRDHSKSMEKLWKWVVRGLFFAVAVKVVLLVVWLAQWPVSHADVVAYWFGVDPKDLDSLRCLMGVDSPLILDLVRPPVDCSMCRNVSAVNRVSQISPELFELKYAYSGIPVVITDATRNWTALQAFSFEFFRGIYAEDSPVLTMSESNCQFFPYKTSFRNLSEVFQMSEARAKMTDGSEPWYIGWSNCDSSAANVLRTYYTRPYFLPNIAESSKTDWIFMGSPGYGAHMHVDNVVNPSWQAQVTGSKLWTLEPPPECYFECQSSIEVQVQPGEIIVLDTNKWYHSTLITGNEMSITIGSEYD